MRLFSELPFDKKKAHFLIENVLFLYALFFTQQMDISLPFYSCAQFHHADNA